MYSKAVNKNVKDTKMVGLIKTFYQYLYKYKFSHFLSSLIRFLRPSPPQQKGSIFKNFGLDEITNFPLSRGYDKNLQESFSWWTWVKVNR